MNPLATRSAAALNLMQQPSFALGEAMTYQPMSEPFEYRPPLNMPPEPPAAHPAGESTRPSPAPPPAHYPNSDKVEQASIDSFPASDPPGYGTGHA